MLNGSKISAYSDILSPFPTRICCCIGEFANLDFIILSSGVIEDIPDNYSITILVKCHFRISDISTDHGDLTDVVNLNICTIVEEYAKYAIVIFFIFTDKQEFIVGNPLDLRKFFRSILRSNLTLLYKVPFRITLNNPHIIGVGRIRIGITANINFLFLIKSNCCYIISSSRSRNTTDCSLPHQNTIGIIGIIKIRAIHAQPDVWVVDIIVGIICLACNINVVVFSRVIKCHFDKFCLLGASILRKKRAIPNQLSKIIKLCNKCCLITISFKDTTTNVSITIAGLDHIVDCQFTCCFQIICNPITSFLKLLRMRNTNLRRIFRIISIT